MRSRRFRRAGFTLVEVMIVLAIVVALGGLVAVAVFQRQDEAKEQLARQDLNTLKNALKLFRLDYGRWPTDEEGIAVLWDRERLDPDADLEKWNRYLEEPMPEDRWGSEWVYIAQSEEDETIYELSSIGPDQEEGTEDDISARQSLEDEDEFGGFEGPPSAPSGGGGGS